MDERLRFIREFETGLFTMTELCEHFAISRKTGYHVLEVYARDGVAGLLPRSRRPHRSPTKTPERIVNALVGCRLRHRRWGPKKLVHYLQQHQPRVCRSEAWPGLSTVARILARHALTTPAPRRLRVWPAPRTNAGAGTTPNAVWTADYKGEFRTTDGRRCYPLTVMDGYSRYLLGCRAFLRPSGADTQRTFQQLFQRYGLPDRIRTDNGNPFASLGVGNLTALSVWWMRLGIVVQRIAPGHPEQNGAHERMHRTLKAETARPPAASLHAQQRRFTAFRREYNHVRPHEALDFAVPATCYVASTRRFPSRLPAVEYLGHVEVRRVHASGNIRIWGRELFVSEALRGEDIGLEEVEDGIWDLCFASTRLARLDRRRWRLYPRPAGARGQS